MAVSLLIWWQLDPVFGPTSSLLNLSSMHDTDTSCLFVLFLGIIPLCLSSLPVWKCFTSILNNVNHPKACSDGSWQGQFKSVTNWLKVTPTFWSLSINLMDVNLKTSQGNHSGTKPNSLKFKLIIKALHVLTFLWLLLFTRYEKTGATQMKQCRKWLSCQKTWTATPSQSISPYFSCVTSTEIVCRCNLHSKAIIMPQSAHFLHSITFPTNIGYHNSANEVLLVCLPWWQYCDSSQT